MAFCDFGYVLKRILWAGLFIQLSSILCSAQTWINPSGGVVSNGANWNTGEPPEANSFVKIELPIQVTFDRGISSANFEAGPGTTLNLNGYEISTSNAALHGVSIQGGGLTVGSTLNISGANFVQGLTSSLSSLNMYVDSGSLTVLEGIIAPDHLEIQGLVRVTNGGVLQGRTMTLYNGGILSVQGGSLLQADSITVGTNNYWLGTTGGRAILSGVTSSAGFTVNQYGSLSAENSTLGAIQVNSGGSLSLTNSSLGSLRNSSSIAFDPSSMVRGNVENEGTLQHLLTISGTLTNFGTFQVHENETLNAQSITNNGTLSVDGGSVLSSNIQNQNEGLILLKGEIRSTNSIYNEATLEVSGSSQIHTQQAFYNQTGASVLVTENSHLTFTDDVSNDSVIALAPDSVVTFLGGLSGSGSFTGPGTVQILGDLRPGHSPGSMSFGGNLEFGDNSLFTLEIAGTHPGIQFDALNIDGALKADGALEILLLNGFNPQIGDQFTVLQFGSLVGNFSQILGLDLGNGLYLSPTWTPNSLTLNTVPEPSTWFLISSGLSILFMRKSPKRKSAEMAGSEH